MYTDGVTEAENANKDMFAEHRLMTALNGIEKGHPDAIVVSVQRALEDFVGEADQFDDITMLALTYKGVDPEAPKHKQSEREFNHHLVVDATLEHLDEVIAFTQRSIAQTPLSRKSKNLISIAVEEIFVNVAMYAYAPARGPIEMFISPDEGVTIMFRDGGMPYNPLERENPNIDMPAEERKIGGLGIFIVKDIMNEVVYRYENGNNVLTIHKKNDLEDAPDGDGDDDA
jgi:sigma-B regulation protein RsbU (phosphoserine phosphatase)